MYQYGDVKKLEEKYGPLRQSTTIFNVPSKPININASFQQQLKITLPLSPMLEVKPVETKEVIKVDTKINEHLEILNFIDAVKLTPGRAGKANVTYSLADLVELSKKLKLPKSQSKPVNIENIKNELNKTFGEQLNLIGQLRQFSSITLNDLNDLLYKNDISTTTLNKLIKTIKTKHGDNIPINDIISILEREWQPIKI